MPTDLHLLRPLWLLGLLALVPVLRALWQRRPGESVWRGLVDPHLLPHLLVSGDGGVRRLPLILLGLGWALVCLALAGPVWERLPQPVFSDTAKRVILLDISPSMGAGDVAPSRLARARFEVLDLLRAAREGQTALIAFGPEPFVVSPLTGDSRTIAAQVPQISGNLIPAPGPKRIDLALDQAADLLKQAGGGGGEVILVTDGLGGSPTARDAALAAARNLAAAGDRLAVLGVGTAEGAPVPGPDGGFVEDSKGAIPMSRLDAKGLDQLARDGGGPYVALDPGDRDTQALMAAGATQTGSRMVEQQGLKADQWREEGPWLLLLVLPLGALAFRRGWLLPVTLVLAVLPPTPSQAAGLGAELRSGWDSLWQRPDQRAAKRLAAGDAAAAAAGFRDPSWKAAAHYKAGDYKGAMDDLDGIEGPEADYNRGNALARLGQLDRAIDAYKRTLSADPSHADARANLDLVERLKREREQKKQEQQQGEGQSKQDKGGKGSQSQGSNGGGQKQSGQQGQSGGQDQAGRQGQSGGQDKSGPGDQGDQGGKQVQAGEKSGKSQQGQESDKGSQQAAGRGEDQSQGQSAQGQSGRTGNRSRPEGPGAEGQENRAAQGSGQKGQAAPPSAADLDANALKGENQAKLDSGQGAEGRVAGATDAKGTEVDEKGRGLGPAGMEDLSPEQRERLQSLETQLRRVPDDPAGLLRQRFLLQHLRREGRLPE